MLTETWKSVLTLTADLLCVCLGKCWLNCGCLKVTQATRTSRIRPPARHPTEFLCHPSFSLPRCGRHTSPVSFHSGWFLWKALCDWLETNPVKAGAWMKVFMLTHYTFTGNGCGLWKNSTTKRIPATSFYNLHITIKNMRPPQAYMSPLIIYYVMKNQGIWRSGVRHNSLKDETFCYYHRCHNWIVWCFSPCCVSVNVSACHPLPGLNNETADDMLWCVLA